MTDSWLSQKVEDLIRACVSLIVIDTAEEQRAVTLLQDVSSRLSCQLFTCDLAEGLQGTSRGNQATTAPNARDPLSLLDQIERHPAEGLYVLKDAQDFWNNPQVKRKLRNLAHRFAYLRKTLVVLGPVGKLPKELEDEAVLLPLPLPNAPELNAVLEQLLRHPAVNVSLNQTGRDKLIQAAAGLTAAQARRAFACAVIQDGLVNDRAIRVVIQEKKRIIAESRALQFHDATESRETVGGLGALKQWLEQRTAAFTEEARAFGLPPPRGILLIGIPGTGKSLTAKMIAHLLQVALLRLDFASIFASLVGESEACLRQALGLIEKISPCVVWIDELEKALAHGGLDGGVSLRVLGNFLTWMAEKPAPCFVVATANDVTQLPPEMLRKGRFDEVFFLDLPTVAERKEILTVHLRKRGRNPDAFDLDRLAREAHGFVGAELEEAVKAALYVAFNDGRRELKTEDILNSLKLLVPLSASHPEFIENLRRWVQEGRARAASLPQDGGHENPPSAGAPPLDIRPSGPKPRS